MKGLVLSDTHQLLSVGYCPNSSFRCPLRAGCCILLGPSAPVTQQIPVTGVLVENSQGDSVRWVAPKKSTGEEEIQKPSSEEVQALARWESRGGRVQTSGPRTRHSEELVSLDFEEHITDG